MDVSPVTDIVWQVFVFTIGLSVLSLGINILKKTIKRAGGIREFMFYLKALFFNN